MVKGACGLTEIKAPSQIIDPCLGELHYNKSAHPVGCRSSRGASRSPTQTVDLRVEDPWYLGEADSVSEVVEEEHRCCYSPESSLVVRMDRGFLDCYGCDEITATSSQ